MSDTIGADHATGLVPMVMRPQDLGFGRLFDHIRDAVIVADVRTGAVVLWNAAAVAMFGYAPDEIRGRPVDALVPARLREQHRAALARYGVTGTGALIEAGRALELPALRKGGEEIQVELSLSPLEDHDGGGAGRRLVLAVVRDVTVRARLEAERAALLATAQDYARRLGELAVLKADFTAMVVHELGSPLAAIRSWADVLATGALTPDEQARALAAIQAETDVLARLVADVRTAAGAERDDFAVHPRPVSLAVLLADAAAYARTLPGAHPFALVSDGDAPVLVDPERLGQVLRNLLSNAAKYSPPGTPIELRALPQGGRIRIQVADRGFGIHPHDLKRVFEKFGRGRDEYGRTTPGVGLGLYLSKRIVQAHGAELTVESLPGVGSVFGFTVGVAS